MVRGPRALFEQHIFYVHDFPPTYHLIPEIQSMDAFVPNVERIVMLCSMPLEKYAEVYTCLVKNTPRVQQCLGLDENKFKKQDLQQVRNLIAFDSLPRFLGNTSTWTCLGNASSSQRVYHPD